MDDDVQKIKDNLKRHNKLTPKMTEQKRGCPANKKEQHIVKGKKSPKTGVFKVKTYGITRRKRKYYYKCSHKGCTSTFNKMTAWNIHHLVRHKSEKFMCDIVIGCLPHLVALETM